MWKQFGEVFLGQKRKGRGKRGLKVESLGFEIVLGFLSKDRDLLDFIETDTFLLREFEFVASTTVSA